MTAKEFVDFASNKSDSVITQKQNLKEKFKERDNFVSASTIGTDYTYKHEVLWKNAIGFFILHLLGVWGTILGFTGYVSWNTFIWSHWHKQEAFIELFTGGAYVTYLRGHPAGLQFYRLKSVNDYLCTHFQNSMFIWVRDHRLHHRYSDTDADPHNSKRGFFFCHVGWLMTKKHPYVITLGRKIDMSDVEEDWMAMFQKKYYYHLYVIFAILIPVLVPVYFFGDSFWEVFLFSYVARYVLSLNGAWLVNSAAHLYGIRPYDKKLQPVESWFVSFITLGEGWHNYHHTFPWDYKAAELTMHFNQSATFIRFFERIGLAYDLKTASPEQVVNRINRCGDGTHYLIGNDKARNAVKAFGPLHPFNPTFTTKYEDPEGALKEEGLPLFHETDVFNNNSTVNSKSVGSHS